MDSPTVSLTELGIEPHEDTGTSWHPRADHPTARTSDGHLRNLTPEQVIEHFAKPEAHEQLDSVVARGRGGAGPMDAEASEHTAGDRV